MLQTADKTTPQGACPLYLHQWLTPAPGKDRAIIAASFAGTMLYNRHPVPSAIDTQEAQSTQDDSAKQPTSAMQPQRIIITFGTNNLSGTSTNAEKFIDTYKKGLKAIHEAYPYAALIVNSIPPLDAQRENSRLSQTQVDAYNEAICEMCTAEGYKYLNSAEALKDETTGWAKKDYTLGDGVHLSKNGVDALFAYIRTHAYENEDTRPKPLKKIPTPKGVQPGLVKNDPIAVRGARVQISVVAGEGGTVSPTDTSAKATLSVSLSALPNEGFEFTGWELVSGLASFSDTAASTTTLTVNSGNDANGIVVRANFRAIEIEEETWGDWETDEAPTCLDEGKAHRTSSWGNREDKTLDACSARIAASRPAPGPLTKTSAERIP